MALQWRHRRANVIGPNFNHWIRDHVQHRLPQSVSRSSSSSITPRVHAVLTAEARIVLISSLTDWLEEERAAAPRQPIGGSGLANVQPRGSSTTVTAPSDSSQTGILRRQREGAFPRFPLLSLLHGSVPCRPGWSLSSRLSASASQSHTPTAGSIPG